MPASPGDERRAAPFFLFARRTFASGHCHHVSTDACVVGPSLPVVMDFAGPVVLGMTIVGPSYGFPMGYEGRLRS